MRYTRSQLASPCIGALVTALVWFCVAANADASTVENYVSVSANSGNNGVSTIHSQTIINGHVIEDVTKTGTGSITYHNSSATDEQPTVVTIATTSSTATDTAQRATLAALLTQLRHYVALLNTLMEQAATR